MTLEWKPYKDKESVFWSQFKKDGDIGLVTKFKGSGDGYNPDASIKPEFQGYVYWAKQAQGKKGPFWVIERKKTSSLGEDSELEIAHQATNKEYQDGAKKGHEENVKMHEEDKKMHGELLTFLTELMVTIKENTNSNINLTESVNALMHRMDAAEGI